MKNNIYNISAEELNKKINELEIKIHDKDNVVRTLFLMIEDRQNDDDLLMLKTDLVNAKADAVNLRSQLIYAKNRLKAINNMKDFKENQPGL